MKPSEYVRELRKKLNISQAQLARALGVTEQTVYNWERSLAVPTRYDAAVLEKLMRVAKTRAVEAVEKAAKANAATQIGILAVGVGIGILLKELFGAGRQGSSRSRGGKRRHK